MQNESKVRIILHHHGDFKADTFRGNPGYIEGITDVINNVDTRNLCLLELEKYSKKFNYS